MGEEKFAAMAALICEPVRAKMLWNLLDGRAYTASELAMAADVSATAASNHLTKLLAAALVKVEVQGRHRYFSFSTPEVAYAVEALANLASGSNRTGIKEVVQTGGVKYCRTCYDHLAGFAGVTITEAMEQQKILKKSGGLYVITSKGWNWLEQFGIVQDDLANTRRPLTRQCLDWSERRPHLAGYLGALLLDVMLKRNWFKKVKFSRELIVSGKGSKELYALLNVQL